MPTFMFNTPSGPKTVRLSRWSMILAGVAAGGLGVLLLLVAASLALVLIPLALGGAAIAGWQMRRQLRKAGVGAGRSGARERTSRRATAPGIIEADYRVVEKTMPKD